MITTYPEFTSLSLDHQEQLSQITAQFEPFSDFNFTSLFCWNVDSSTEISLLNGNLVIRMPDYLDGHPVYSLLGDQLIDASIETLLEATNKLELVPEVVVEAMQSPSKYRVVEDEDNFDYICNLTHLSDMPGSKFKKKRNKTNVFIKAHDNYELEVRLVTSLDHNHAEMLRHIDRQWATQSSRDEGDILSERKSLDRLLGNSSAFKLIIIELWVDDSLKAFSINEVINDSYAICHFEKALKVHHENIYTFLVVEVAKHLRQTGCRWVNWEQDLGLEGLRRSKRSYHPSHMLKKYTISAHH